jgi:hypothetical protein
MKMAHFAELDENNVVLRVIVVDNVNLLDDLGHESEQVGIDYIHGILGSDSTWVQTSYNGSFRKIYAGIGFTYDPANDEFVAPEFQTSDEFVAPEPEVT